MADGIAVAPGPVAAAAAQAAAPAAPSALQHPEATIVLTDQEMAKALTEAALAKMAAMAGAIAANPPPAVNSSITLPLEAGGAVVRLTLQQ